MPLIRTELHSGLATITLADPGRRNALSLPMVSEIVACLDELEADATVGALIVTGAPPAFCAGADLSYLSDASGEGAESRLRAIYEGFLRFARSPVPSIAAVNGPAVGAGMNLALACDLRLAGASARFDARFLRLGLHPGGGHTWMLRRAVGAQATAAAALFGEVLDGAEAERVGLVHRCVEDDELLAAAREMAARAAAAPVELVRRIKATIAAAAAVASLEDAVELELGPQVRSLAQVNWQP